MFKIRPITCSIFRLVTSNMKKIIFTILIAIFLATFTSSQATEGKCKITEIVDYSYVHRCEMDNGGICSYTGRDETTITCNF